MWRVVIVVLALVILLSFCACAWQDINDLSEPPSNLEFWIEQNVDEVDFSGYTEKYGLFGGREYYGSGYVPTIDGDGQQADPEHCVIYTVTSYPDYSSGKQHITAISITDPEVVIYGLTVNSTDEEIRYQMGEKNGFDLEEPGAGTLIAKKGKLRISFSEGAIYVSVEVTNILGIVF